MGAEHGDVLGVFSHEVAQPLLGSAVGGALRCAHQTYAYRTSPGRIDLAVVEVRIPSVQQPALPGAYRHADMASAVSEQRDEAGPAGVARWRCRQPESRTSAPRRSDRGRPTDANVDHSSGR